MGKRVLSVLSVLGAANHASGTEDPRTPAHHSRWARSEPIFSSTIGLKLREMRKIRAFKAHYITGNAQGDSLGDGASVRRARSTVVAVCIPALVFYCDLGPCFLSCSRGRNPKKKARGKNTDFPQILSCCFTLKLKPF